MTVGLLSRKCPICASTVYSPVLQKQTLSLVRCGNCSMVYANPIEEGWASGSYYDQLAVPFYLSSDKVQSDYSAVRFARELKLFRRFCRAGRVLDVGCSTGAFLFQLRRSFAGSYDVLGVDVAGPALDYAQQQGVPVLRDSFLTADFSKQRFSAVTFWAVMEHLNEPRAYLARAVELLRPSGFCFILVPNFRSLAVRLTGAKYRYIFPQHINYFTAKTLRTLALGLQGMELVYAGSTHFNPLVIWQDWRGAGQFVPDEARAKLLKRTTAYKQNPLLQPIKLGLGCVEWALGKLNLADNLVVVLRKSG